MAQEPAVVYPPPLGEPPPPPPAPPESGTGPGRASPQSVLLGAGAVALVAASAASLTVGGPVGRGLAAVLACITAAVSLQAGRRDLRTSEEALAGATAALALLTAYTPGSGWHPPVAAGLAAVLVVLGRLGRAAVAWPVGAWAAAQLAVLGGLEDLGGGTAPHAAAVVSTALAGLLVVRSARRPVAVVALVTTAPWWVAGVAEGLRLAWAADTASGARAVVAALVVAAAVALVALWTRPLLHPLLGPRPLVPVLSGVVAGAAVAGALSATGPAWVPPTGYLGLGLAAVVAAKASPSRESVLRPFGLTAACTLTALAVGQLLADGRWPALSLMLATAALPALLVAARQPVDRPGALPVAVGCLAGSVLLGDAGGVLSPGTTGLLLLGLSVAALVAATLLAVTLLKDERSEPPLATTGAVVGWVALAVPGEWSSAAPQLAVLGAALTGYGTVVGRDLARAAGCTALVLAAWLTAARYDATEPEAWTLPAAAGLLLYAGRGLVNAPSWSSWGPGLVTGFAPSAVLAVLESDVLRVLLVVAAATLTTTMAAWRAVQAPLVVGSVSLVFVAVGQLVDVLPWPGLVVVAVGGALTVVAGVLYERERRYGLDHVDDLR